MSARWIAFTRAPSLKKLANIWSIPEVLATSLFCYWCLFPCRSSIRIDLNGGCSHLTTNKHNFTYTLLNVTNEISPNRMCNTLPKLPLLSLFLTAVLKRFIRLNNVINEVFKKGALRHISTSNRASFKRFSSFLVSAICPRNYWFDIFCTKIC